MIRVGREYWATATTSGWAPLFPLLRSTDLRTWQQVGSVFQQRPAWAETNFWAPEIAADKGRYFIYYTAKKRGGPLCVAVADADRPAGPYTDHGPLVCQEAGSIDAVPVTDENGQRWLVWKEDGNSRRQPTPLWAQRLSDDGLRLSGELHELIRNDVPWEGQVVEGAFFVRRGDWWYLFYSGAGCCGRKCDYALGVARAKKLLGPWEKYPRNPILKGNSAWACPGHGSIVDDGRGRMWLLYHAYNTNESIFTGRQGMLGEVVWAADGWPSISGPGTTRTAKAPTIEDEFATGLAPEWSWPVAQKASVRTVPSNGGWLELTAQDGEAVAARLPWATEYRAATTVDLHSLEAGSRAGIAALANRAHVVALTADEKGTLTLWQRFKGTDKEIVRLQGPTDSLVHLRMSVADGNRFSFAFSKDGKSWVEVNSDGLQTWDMSARMALIVTGSGETRGRFGYFRAQ